MMRISLKRTALAGALALTTIGATLGVAGAQGLPVSGPDHAIQQGYPGGPNQPGRPGRGEGNGSGEQRPQLTDEQRQQMEQQREAAQQRYIDALAKNLGMDSSTVKAALEQTQKDMQAARIAEIKQAVTDGKLTQEQADQLIERIENGGPGGPMMGGPGMGGPGMGGPGMGGPGMGGPGMGGPAGPQGNR
ncbi:MAG: hypothetical protein IT306_23660 [Chloroflexi bacterium]|nr:hypothetical protein [Chloroflexota bacterium]